MDIEKVIKFIKNENLSTADISNIFRALTDKENCLAGKIWTTDDIDKVITENFGNGDIVVTEDWRDDITRNMDTDSFNDCVDEVGNYIMNSIKKADLTVYVTDIVWDLNPVFFDCEEDLESEKARLPEKVDIPLNELEGEEIADWLSDHYDNLVESYCVSNN